MFRQLMVMDETHVMNQCKEDVCFMSQDFWKDMKIARWGQKTHLGWGLIQYKDSHYKDEMIVKLSDLYNGNSYTGKLHFYIK